MPCDWGPTSFLCIGFLSSPIIKPCAGIWGSGGKEPMEKPGEVSISRVNGNSIRERNSYSYAPSKDVDPEKQC